MPRRAQSPLVFGGALALLGMSACSCRSSDSGAAEHWAIGASCPGAPVIGVLESGGSCDLDGAVPPMWRARVMFGDGSPGVAALEQPVPAGLRGYCSYAWTGDGDPGEAFAALHRAIADYPYMKVEMASPDCHAAIGHGTSTQEAVELARRDAFRLDLDWVDGAALEASAGARARIEIAVADTLPAAPPREPVHAHGEVVAAVIVDVACPDRRPGCLGDVRHTLALPRVDVSSPPNWTDGGDRGTRGDVALAIYEAVASWRARNLDDPRAPRRLVLNLSLGWSPDPNGELAPTQALVAALRYASCQGALIFAAAGNDPRQRAGEDGPLEPARFEALAAPSSAECEALGFSPAADPRHPVFGPGERPLLWAVGGVDGDDRTLLDARPHSRPKLVAPAMDGLALGRDGELTRALTGSSIAAAVASGAAALVWSYRPELRADEIVELLYASGWDTGAPVDFGLEQGGPSTSAHRISICAALAQACAGRASDACPQLDCRAGPPAGDEHRRALVEAMRRLHDDPDAGVRVHHGGATRR